MSGGAGRGWGCPVRVLPASTGLCLRGCPGMAVVTFKDVCLAGEGVFCGGILSVQV